MASTFTIKQEGGIQGKTINLTYYQDRNYLRIFLDNYPTSDLQVSFIATNGSGLNEVVTLSAKNTLVTMSHSSTMRYNEKIVGIDTIINKGTGLKFTLSIKIYNTHNYPIGVNMGFYSYWTTLNNMTPNCDGTNDKILKVIQPNGNVSFYGDFLQAEEPYIDLSFQNDRDSVYTLTKESSSPYIRGLTISNKIYSGEKNYFRATIDYPNDNTELIYRY